MKVTWSAKNDSSFLNGQRAAGSMRSAVTAAKRYIMGELYGEGIATIYEDGAAVRQIERSIFTRMTWRSTSVNY